LTACVRRAGRDGRIFGTTGGGTTAVSDDSMFKRRVGELVKRPGLVPAEATAAAAATAMVAQDLSCLAVVAGRRVVGFVTERDLCRRLDVDVEESTPVGEILTRAVALVPKSMLLDEAIKVMLDRRTRHLAVLGLDGSLCGLVMDKNLVEALAVDFMVENIACRELVHPTVAAVSPDISVREALAFMREKNFDAVLGVRGEKPVGIFTDRDAISRILGYPERLAEPLAGSWPRRWRACPWRPWSTRSFSSCANGACAGWRCWPGTAAWPALLDQQGILHYSRRMA